MEKSDDRRRLNLNYRALVLVSLSTAGIWFGRHNSAGPTAVAQENKTPIGVGSIKTANQQLEEAVRIKLRSDEELREARLMVSADVTRNQVTLSGSVASSTLREKAIELARGAQVGVIVNDRIEVRPNSTRTPTP